ncbi:MAG: S41 family peptidase [Sphingobacteriales bacterium JAD_PAG50586_3]|nr:MAG: S41 family peptidase [Sphingobacteriales bacterium JAD_PAG50586_3]
MRFITILFILFTSLNITAQTAITKQQAYNDFDFLVDKIETVNPSIKIKSQLYGYSIIDSIKSYRKDIEKDTSFEGLYNIVKKALNSCLDGHSAITGPFLLYKNNINLRLYLNYYNGVYFTIRPFTYNGQHYPMGGKLVSINGHSSDSIIDTLQPYRYMLRHDHTRNKFYSEIFYLADNYIQQNRIKLGFEYNSTVITDTFYIDKAVDFDNPIEHFEDTKKVTYFDSLSILYIRVPTMDWANRNFYKKAIKKAAKSRTIKKVVVDVRYNSGGSSVTGRNIMRMLIDKPIKHHTKNYGNNPQFLTKKYKKLHGYNTHITTDTIGFLSNSVFYKFIDRPTVIKPFKQSIKHKGPIYIIGNEWIYSAAGAIFQFANANSSDNIISIGTRTGHMLGEFSDPLHFTLPNSGINFIIAPAIDFTGVTNTQNLFLDYYNYEVTPTPAQQQCRYTYKGDIYGQDYLIKYDPYFKPVIINK